MSFNEKTREKGLPVWQTPKYLESKAKALEMIEKGGFGLTEGDFWILMNKTGDKSKMAYTGLIISHNGCLKINDKIDNKVDPKAFSLDKQGFNNSLVYTYIDNDTYEVGEVSAANCMNPYPYAMAFKRCFDRVVLKKSKLAYAGIYSEVEADEFKANVADSIEEITPVKNVEKTPEQLAKEKLEALGVEKSATVKEPDRKQILDLRAQMYADADIY